MEAHLEGRVMVFVKIDIALKIRLKIMAMMKIKEM